MARPLASNVCLATFPTIQKGMDQVLRDACTFVLAGCNKDNSYRLYHWCPKRQVFVHQWLHSAAVGLCRILA
jgi:hypothetical protein